MLYSVTQRSISFLYSISIFSIHTPQKIKSLTKVQSNSISIVAVYDDDDDDDGEGNAVYERFAFATQKKMHSLLVAIGMM